MKAPGFWWTPRATPLARLLAPAGAAFGAATAWRMHRPGLALPVPVLCVGNLVAGGAGKTPVALALLDHLQARGRRPAVLSRGYGRKSADRADAPFRVDPTIHDAARAGDEPLLLARAAPTYVGSDRKRAAALALAEGADCLVLDDGLQNPSLRKTWTVAVVDGASGIGNGLCLPAGPLRAPVASQWGAVTSVCVVGAGEPGQAVAQLARDAGLPVLAARLRPDAAVLARWRGRELYAFAGIGRPDKFFATLRDAGLQVAGTRAFPDHHRFAPADCRALERAAGAALLVTTAKDAVRLPPSFPAEVLPVEAVFDDPAMLAASLPV